MGRVGPSALTRRSWIGPHSSMRSVANSITWTNAPGALGGSQAGVIAARRPSRSSGPSTWPWTSTACRAASSSSSSGSPCRVSVHPESLGTARQSIIMRLMGLPLIGIGSAVLPSPTDGARTPLEDRQPTVNRYRHRVLSVQLLGDITVERDGVPVVLSGPQRRLLTFLALHPGPHDRDALAARFWPDTP